MPRWGVGWGELFHPVAPLCSVCGMWISWLIPKSRGTADILGEQPTPAPLPAQSPASGYFTPPPSPPSLPVWLFVQGFHSNSTFVAEELPFNMGEEEMSLCQLLGLLHS